MNKRFKSFLLLVCSVALVSSCNDSLQQNMPILQQNIQYTGEYINIDMDIVMPSSNTPPTKNNSRSLSIISDLNGLMQINYDKYLDNTKKENEMNVYFALRKSGMQDSEVTYFSLPARIVKNSDGTYRLKAKNLTFQMNTQSSPLDNDYFIQAITLGPGTDLKQNVNDKSFEYEMKIQKGGIVSEVDVKNNIKSLNIPLTTEWHKVKYDNKSKMLKIDNLTFKPQGIIIKFDDIDKDLNLLEKIELKGITIDAYGICSSGTFKLGKLSNGNTNIKGGEDVLFEYNQGSGAVNASFNAGGLNQFGWSKLDIDIEKSNGSHQELKNGGKNGCYIYVMPYTNPDLPTDYKIYYSYKYSTIGHHNDEVYLTGKIKKEFTPTHLMSGKVVTIKNGGFEKSDLMISEFYHFNPSKNNSSMIEIYNPTNEHIDLKDYQLLRLRTFTESGGPGLHPSDTWNGAYGVLAQPIYMDPNIPSGTKFSPTADGSEYPQTGGVLDTKLRYIYMYGTDNNPKQFGSKLAPGHCIVLCSEGIYKELHGRTQPHPEYLPEGSDIGFTNLKEEITSKGGKCKYVVAVTNYFGSDDNDDNDIQYNPASGTFTHGSKHIMVLTKNTIDEKGRHTFELIDQAGPAFDYTAKYDFEDKEGWKEQTLLYENYINTFQFKEFVLNSSLRDDFDMIRRPGVVFPSPTDFKYNLQKYNDEEYRDWDIYMTAFSSLGDKDRPYALQFPDRVAKHSFGRRY